MGKRKSITTADSQGDDRHPPLEVPTTDISELVSASSGAELATRLWERIERRFEAVSSATRDVVTGRSSPAWLDLVMAGTSIASMRDIRYVLMREDWREAMLLAVGEKAAQLEKAAQNLKKGGRKGKWTQAPYRGDKKGYEDDIRGLSETYRIDLPGRSRYDRAKLIAEAMQRKHRSYRFKVSRDTIYRAMNNLGLA
ncbi:MAG: hypothetical protein RBU21_14625 [FCB group bacterium]|jgi:hypothetical protein|nr:hypothetical protein [FCB group bacterium]